MGVRRLGFLIVFAVMMTVARPLPAPIDVGSGGDVIFCTRSPENDFEGFYFFDYLLALTHYPAGKYPWQAWLKHTGKTLYEKAPAVYPLYQEFVDSFLSASDGGKYRWIESGPLEDILDEALGPADLGKIPRNCKKPDGSWNKFQAVIRRQVGSGIEFRYDKKLIDEMKLQKANDQLAYLLYHEFFWNFVHNAYKLRQAMRVLHFSADSPQMLQTWMVGWIKVNFFPDFPGDTRSLRLRPRQDGQTLKLDMAWDDAIPNHQLILFNDFSEDLMIQERGSEKVWVTVPAGGSGSLRWKAEDAVPHAQEKWDFLALDKQHKIRAILDLDEGGFGEADIFTW